MSARDFEPDHKGIDQLLRSPGMGAAMVQAAEAGRAFAEVTAPRRTGTYARSFVVRAAEVTTRSRLSPRRAGAVLENTAPHAAAVERQSKVLGRTVDIIESGGL